MNEAADAASHILRTVRIGFFLYGVSFLVFFVILKSGRVMNPTQSPDVFGSIVLVVSTIFAILIGPVLVAVPAMRSQWRRKYGRHDQVHPVMAEAIAVVDRARREWKVLVSVWLVMNFLPALVLLGRVVRYYSTPPN